MRNCHASPTPDLVCVWLADTTRPATARLVWPKKKGKKKDKKKKFQNPNQNNFVARSCVQLEAPA